MDETMLKIPNDPLDHLSTEAMSLALDGLLDATEQQEFDAHLAACDICRAQWLKWRRISDVFRVEPFTAPASGFMLRVDQAVQRDEKRRERLWGGLVLVGGTLSIWTVLLMGLALTMTVGMTVFSGSQVDPLKLSRAWRAGRRCACTKPDDDPRRPAGHVAWPGCFGWHGRRPGSARA